MESRTIFTLHLEHYLGIGLFLKSPENAMEADLLILERVRNYLQNLRAPLRDL